MKIFVKFMAFAVIAAVGGLFVIKGPDGQPIMTLNDLKPEVPSLGPGPDSGAPTTVYKWKDADGVWQFSSEPLEGIDAGAPVEKIELSGDINTVPAFRGPPSAGAGKPSMPSLSGLPGGLTTISPDKIEELTQAAQQIEETAAKRKQQIDQAVGR